MWHAVTVIAMIMIVMIILYEFLGLSLGLGIKWMITKVQLINTYINGLE